jgi:hypothetical protein
VIVSVFSADPFHVYVYDASSETSTWPSAINGTPVLKLVFVPNLEPELIGPAGRM